MLRHSLAAVLLATLAAAQQADPPPLPHLLRLGPTPKGATLVMVQRDGALRGADGVALDLDALRAVLARKPQALLAARGGAGRSSRPGPAGASVPLRGASGDCGGAAGGTGGRSGGEHAEAAVEGGLCFTLHLIDPLSMFCSMDTSAPHLATATDGHHPVSVARRETCSCRCICGPSGGLRVADP